MVEEIHDAIANAAIHTDAQPGGVFPLHDLSDLQQEAQFDLFLLHHVLVWTFCEFLQQKLFQKEI